MAGVPMVPPGLQDLIPVSHFYVNQTWNHTFQNYCTYDLIGPNGHRVYEAKEYREFCGPRMDIRVHNLQGYNVLNLLLPAHFCSWESRLQVIDASGRLLGFVEKNWSFSAASFDILSPNNQLCLKVQGPGWGEGFMSDQVYQVLSADKSFAVGHITRVWQGLGREMLTREDKFVVQFPTDLEVSMKAILIACTLMIDLLDHERRRQSSHR